MKISLMTVLLGVVFVMSLADVALAWGPATHVGLAGSVLNALPLLPAAVGAILARHGIAYIYGNIAADIVFAKRMSRVKQSCHHWSTAFRLLESAAHDRDRAFAYGYLSHLAADTVAHGKFVPRQVLNCGSTLNFGHLYWELRADADQTNLTWRQLESLLDADHHGHHCLLEPLIRDTLLPYDINRLLFNRMNALTVRPAFRRTVEAWCSLSRWTLSPVVLDGYQAESVERIQAILRDQERSTLLREDPNGTSALMQVRDRRKETRRLKRKGVPLDRRSIEAASAFAPVVGRPPNALEFPLLTHAEIQD